MKFKKVLKIGNKFIGETYPCFIIAEAGVNHNGNMKIAKKLIDVAKEAGADGVKFQLFKTENLTTRDAPKAAYQKKTVKEKSQFAMLKELELSKAQVKELIYYCYKQNIIFLCTPFDHESATILFKLNIPAFKIPSGEINNFPLLRQIAEYKKPIILPTGMSTLAEVDAALKEIYTAGNNKLVVLHCTSNYPTAYQDVNLKAIITMKKKFNVLVGYSDHTPGIEIACAASTMGACVFEKHFTLDRNLPGPDHKASLEPDELKKMIKSIRNIEKALGDGIKRPAASELDTKKVARKSIVASVAIKKGTALTNKMLAFKRPGTGIEPKDIEKIIGKISKVSLKKDELIKWSQLK